MAFVPIVAESRRAPLFGVFLAAWLGLWALAPAREPVRDAITMRQVAEHLAFEGRLDVDARVLGHTVTGPDGREFAKFALLPSLLFVPSAWIERPILRLAMPFDDRELALRLVRGLVPAAIGALALGLLFAALVGLGAPPGRALVLSAGVHLAGPALPYLRTFEGEGTQLAAVALALCLLARFESAPAPRRAAWLGLGLGLLPLAKITLAITGLAFGAVVLWRAWQRRDAPMAALLGLGALPGLTAFAWTNVVRFGTLLPVSQGWYIVPERLGGPLDIGLYGLLVSPGAGLCWYLPLVWLVPWGLYRALRARDPVGLAVGVAIGSHTLFHASWTIWHGSEGWGPRFLVPLAGPLAVLASVALEGAFTRARRVLTGALVALGVVVNLPGLLIHPLDFYAVLPYRPHAEVRLDAGDRPLEPVEADNLARAHFDPAFSPIVGHLWLLRHTAEGGPLETDCPWRDRVAPGAVLRAPDLVPRVDLAWRAEPRWSPEVASRALLLGALLAGLAALGWGNVAARLARRRTH